MKKNILNVLACPKCLGPVEMEIFEESKSGDVINGNLLCDVCSVIYPINKGIFSLLDSDGNKIDQ